LTDTTAIPC